MRHYARRTSTHRPLATLVVCAATIVFAATLYTPARAVTFSATCATLQTMLDNADAGDLVILTGDCHLGASSPSFVLRRTGVTLEGLADGGSEPQTLITADAGAVIVGLQITGNYNQVRRLKFTGFGQTAIHIEGGGMGLGTGVGNFIGMDGGAAKDQVVIANTRFRADFMIEAPCQGAAICIRGNGASDNVIDSALLTNNFVGVEIIDSAHKNTVRGCTITGNIGFGILVARGRDSAVAAQDYVYNYPNNIIGNTVRQSGLAGIALFGTDPQTIVEDAGDRVLGNTVQCTTGVLPDGGAFPSYGFKELVRLMQRGRINGTGVIVASDGDRGASGNAWVGSSGQPNTVQWNAGFGILNMLSWDTVYDSNIITDNQKSGFADVLSLLWFYVPQFYAFHTLYDETYATEGAPRVLRNTIMRNGAALPPGSIASCAIAPTDASACAATPLDGGGWIGENDGVFVIGSNAELRGNTISQNAGYGLSAHTEFGQFWVDFYGFSSASAVDFVASPLTTNDDTWCAPTLGASLSTPAASFPAADRNIFENNRLGGAIALDCPTTASANVGDYNDFSRANCGRASFSQSYYGAVEVLREVDAGQHITVDGGVTSISIRSALDASTVNFAGDGGVQYSNETDIESKATGNGAWGPVGFKYHDARTWFQVPAFEIFASDGGLHTYFPQLVEVTMSDAGVVASTLYSYDSVGSTFRGIQRRLAPGVTDSKTGLDHFQIASAAIPLVGAVGATAVIATFPDPAAGNAGSTPIGVLGCVVSGGYFAAVSATLDWGDGTPQESCLTANPNAPLSHLYSVAGSYTMTLTLRDAAGQTLIGTKGVTILTTNSFGIPVGPPQLRIVALPTEGNAPLAVSFSSVATPGLNATSIDGYLWDFGDGTSATTSATTKTFATAGSQRVKLTVVDNNGVTSKAEELILVTADGGRPPTVEAFASTVSGDGPITVTFSALTNPTDVVSTSWDFGDDAGTQTGKTVVHSFSTPGIYTTRVTVTDNSGLTGRDSVEVIVTKNGKIPPKIISIGGSTADVAIAYVYDSDNKVAVRGTPPFVFQAGKSVAGATVNTVSGFTISPATGLIDWVPMASQGGGQTFDISITVTGASQTTDNTFITTSDWRVTVSGGANALKAVRGCSCELGDDAAAPAGVAFVALVLLLAPFAIGRRRKRRS